MDDLNRGVIRIDDVSKTLAPKFTATFGSLLSVMAIQEVKEQAKRAKELRQPASQPTSFWLGCYCKEEVTSKPRHLCS